jgi:hypothetical protein
VHRIFAPARLQAVPWRMILLFFTDDPRPCPIVTIEKSE